ncbi:MAG TPA: hypothetical protein VET24_11110 [Actinomycetota bacterium]|nr:hypothetical protein [Actinomycetota bacterium]
MSNDVVDLLFAAARTALERGESFPAQFVIPVGERRWRVAAHDLVATGQNDFGIPPKAFSHGAVGMLVAALGAQECYAAEAVGAGSGPVLVPELDRAGENAFRQAVVVTVFAKDRLEVHVLPCGKDGEGAVRWSEPTVRSTTEPGPLGAALPLWRALNREPTALPPADGLIEDMVDSGFVVVVED